MKAGVWLTTLVIAVFAGVADGSQIATVEVQVIDQATGSLLASGGPWAWAADAQALIEGVPAGDGRTLMVWCKDANGRLLYTGEMPDVPVPPMDPFAGTGFLVLLADRDDIYVVSDGFIGMGAIALVAQQPTEIEVTVDIKPGSTQNPVNVTSKGVLPVVVLGNADFDVRAVDLASLELAGVAPVRTAVEDVEAMADLTEAPDGFKDLVLHFRTQDIVAALGAVKDREVLALTLTGGLTDSTPITGVDNITVIGKVKKITKPASAVKVSADVKTKPEK
jgi:hypothetical protein